MAKGRNKAFIVQGIRTLLERNCHIEFDLIDIESEVDSTLSFAENYEIIKDKYIAPTGRMVLIGE